MPSSRRAVAALALPAALAALAACGPSLEPRTAPGPAGTPAPPAAAPAFAWATTGQGAYRVTSRAAIAVAEEAGEVGDTVTTAALVRVALVDGRITGAVDSLHVQAGPRVPPAPPPTLPVRFTGTLHDGRATLAATPVPPPPDTPAPPTPSCAAADAATDAALAAARELFPAVPPGATVGSRWADTVRTSSCRGGLRLDVTAVHRYTMAGRAERDGQPALRVERETALVVQGAGEQAREAVAATGRGTGRATLHLAPTPGRLLHATAETTLELAFTGAGRTQRVVQRSVTEVRGMR